MRWLADILRTWALAGMLAFAAIAPASAQGADDPAAVDSIIGSDVEEEEARASADAEKVIAAIEKTQENIAAVRKVTNLEKVDIVFLSDAAATEGGPPPEIEAKIEEHEEEVKQLREEIEANAMLYHAINSREILPRDVLAVEFDSANGVVIYAAAKPSD